MSAEVQESGNKKKGSKQKKMTVRVDFTPMVDMNMRKSWNIRKPISKICIVFRTERQFWRN